MSKYVRTEDGVYEVVDNLYENGTWYYRKDNQAIPFKDNQYNQADTIEELCDCFITEGNRHIVWDKQQNIGITFEQVKESFTNYHFKIYGAIWTPKGLIYVAKMNNKGELELI